MKCDNCNKYGVYAEVYVIGDLSGYWYYACKKCFQKDYEIRNSNGYCILPIWERIITNLKFWR